MTFYDFGLEQVSDVNGWALFSGSEGETPTFCGFFTDEAAAHLVSSMKDPDEPEEPLYFEPAVILAVLTSDMGVVAENDSAIRTHNDLRALIQTARAAGMASEVR